MTYQHLATAKLPGVRSIEQTNAHIKVQLRYTRPYIFNVDVTLPGFLTPEQCHDAVLRRILTLSRSVGGLAP